MKWLWILCFLVFASFAQTFRVLFSRPFSRKLHFDLYAAQVKIREAFVCSECGAEYLQWMGKCAACQEWNSIKPIKFAASKTSGHAKAIKSLGSSTTEELKEFVPMESVSISPHQERLPVFSSEVNRIFGGGLVKGSVTLLAGEPGIGKSTLLIQIGAGVVAALHSSNIPIPECGPVVYISGEETVEQVVGRTLRLGLSTSNISVLSDSNIDRAVELLNDLPVRPSVVLVDSIQTMSSSEALLSSFAVGSVAQIRESTSKIIRYAKSTGVPTILLGHVTKSGDIGGPRMLEHMVDVVLSLDSSGHDNIRILRGVKNRWNCLVTSEECILIQSLTDRFGPTSEVGILEMTPSGLEDVQSPSGTFLSKSALDTDQEGSAVAVVLEGSR